MGVSKFYVIPYQPTINDKLGMVISSCFLVLFIHKTHWSMSENAETVFSIGMQPP